LKIAQADIIMRIENLNEKAYSKKILLILLDNIKTCVK